MSHHIKNDQNWLENGNFDMSHHLKNGQNWQENGNFDMFHHLKMTKIDRKMEILTFTPSRKWTKLAGKWKF